MGEEEGPQWAVSPLCMKHSSNTCDKRHHLDSAASVQVCRVEEQVSIVAEIRIATSSRDISARQSAVLSIGVAKGWELGKYKDSGAG